MAQFNILCDHCLHDSGLYIHKILTKREMVNCQKINFWLFLTINSVITAVRELNGASQISLVTHDAKGEMREIEMRYRQVSRECLVVYLYNILLAQRSCVSKNNSPTKQLPECT